jgi:hypothetical protein
MHLLIEKMKDILSDSYYSLLRLGDISRVQPQTDQGHIYNRANE